MKKFTVALSLVLTFILCLPSVSVSADNEVFPGYYTDTSVSDFVSGNFTGSLGSVSRSDNLNIIYKATEGSISSDALNIANDIDLSGYSTNSIVVLLRENTIYYLCVIDFGTSNVAIINNDYFYTFIGMNGISNPVLHVYSYNVNTVDSSNVSYTTYTTSYATDEENDFWYINFPQLQSYLTGAYIIYGYNIGAVLCLNEYNCVLNSHQGIFRQIYMIRDYYLYYQNDFTNYWSNNLPYYDGSEIVDPEGGSESIETNENHLYLTNFDTGFCKPYHNNTLGAIGGAYVYMKYNFDSWVNSHISDYSLQVITQLDVNGTTTTYPSLWNLDAQGCTVLSLKTLAASFHWTQQNMLFLEYPNDVLFGNYVKGALYNMSSANYVNNNFYERVTSSSGRGEPLFITTNGTTHRLLADSEDTEYFNGSSNTQFKISFIVRLVDNVSGETSGSFVETHDLISGISSVTNDQLRDNENPYIPDNEVYIPVENSGGGYQVIQQGDSVVVNNMTPSQIKLVIDNGFEKFVAWYNSDPSTAEVSTGFWNSFGIFRNNPAIDLYEEYFGFLPTGFKDIILGCATIGIVGGVFCAIRRKLT